MDKDLLEFLQSFREETTRRFDGIGQEFQEIRKEFGQELQNVRQELRSLREENEQRFEKMENEVRGAHVLFEDLRDTVQIVAEGVAGFTEQLQNHKEEVSKRLDTIESFTRLCYQDLDIRVRRLEAT